MMTKSQHLTKAQSEQPHQDFLDTIERECIDNAQQNETNYWVSSTLMMSDTYQPGKIAKLRKYERWPEPEKFISQYQLEDHPSVEYAVTKADVYDRYVNADDIIEYPISSTKKKHIQQNYCHSQGLFYDDFRSGSCLIKEKYKFKCLVREGSKKDGHAWRFHVQPDYYQYGLTDQFAYFLQRFEKRFKPIYKILWRDAPNPYASNENRQRSVYVSYILQDGLTIAQIGYNWISWPFSADRAQIFIELKGFLDTEYPDKSVLYGSEQILLSDNALKREQIIKDLSRTKERMDKQYKSDRAWRQQILAEQERSNKAFNRAMYGAMQDVVDDFNKDYTSYKNLRDDEKRKFDDLMSEQIKSNPLMYPSESYKYDTKKSEGWTSHGIILSQKEQSAENTTTASITSLGKTVSCKGKHQKSSTGGRICLFREGHDLERLKNYLNSQKGWNAYVSCPFESKVENLHSLGAAECGDAGSGANRWYRCIREFSWDCEKIPEYHGPSKSMTK
ncbi:hypothetical protein ACXWTF_11085 [Thiomicrolovo sp. ZZH C-3]